MSGWVWNAQLLSGSYEWSDLAGHPVEKKK